MAEIVQYSRNGESVYPVTIVEAIADATRMKNLRTVLTEVETKAAGWRLVQDSENPLKYTLVDSDGEAHGIINIPIDTFLDSATYNATTHILTLVFNTASGKTAVVVDLGALVDVYTEGDGISIEYHEISIQIDPASASFLSVSENGLRFGAEVISTTVYDNTNYPDITINAQ